jgi:threonine/homoserine/homoserine lactone efflux protein
MIDLIRLGQGWVLGFLIAAPIGPVGLMCFERSIRTGFFAGIASGIGAALADGFYAAVAGFGIISIMNFLKANEQAIAFGGCALLIGLGTYSLFRNQPKNMASNLQASSKIGIGIITYTLQTFAITITNPATIISFIAAFTSVGVLQGAHDFVSASILVLGVFLGSLSWWLILCGGALMLRHRLSNETVTYINKVMAIGLVLFGCLLLAGYL